MRLLKSLSIGIILLFMGCIISACGNSVSSEDLTTALDTKDINQIVEIIGSYQEQSNKSELDDVVVEYFKDLSESKDYEDFVFMRKLEKKVSDEALKKELQTIIDDSYENRIVAFTSGKWVRRDYTDADGMVIDIKWADGEGTAIITSAKIKNNKNGFQKNDVKWRNAKVISKNELSYEDLCRSEDESHYDQAYAKIDFKKAQIVCSITSDKETDYASGSKQVWVKKSKISKEKENLTKDDFTIDGEKEVLSDDNFSYYYSDDYIDDKSLKKKVKEAEDEDDDNPRELKRGIALKDSRTDVIKKYGYGRIIYRPAKDYGIFDGFQSQDDVIGKGAAYIWKNSEYSALYRNKKNSDFILMFFSSDDKVMGYFIGGDYALLQ